ncbi:MAG: hypothetical protein KF718_17905 [Polyangiaceae bacterium]|nr:hypothetical protein [Polyangiaceae bacterium]
MGRPLTFKSRVRLAPSALDPEHQTRRRSRASAAGAAAAYAALLAACWALGSGRIPVAAWLDDALSVPSVAAAPRPVARLAPVVPAPDRPPIPTRSITAEPSFPQAAAPAVAHGSPFTEEELDAVEPPASLEEAPPTPAPERASAAALAAPSVPDAVPPPAPTAAPPSAAASAASASDGLSCEAARERHSEEIVVGSSSRPPDLPREAFQSVLGSGHYLSGCGVPSTTAVDICAAIRDGRAIGVTVTTRPGDEAMSRCISRAVRKLSFPQSPHLDVTRTRFAASR